MSKQIQLTKGKFALVDDEDYERLSQWKWQYSTGGYAVRSVGSRSKHEIRMHREIMTGDRIDHINRNKLDNRRSNLRVASKSQNKANSKKHNNCRSIFKGVSQKSLKYRRKDGSLCQTPIRFASRITVNGKTTRLGYYKSELEAALAYDKAARHYFGEYACVNMEITHIGQGGTVPTGSQPLGPSPLLPCLARS